MEKFYIEKPSQERKYRRLGKLGAELGIPITECFLEMEVKLPNGKVMHHHKQRSHSWIRNAYNVIFMAIGMVNCNGGATYQAGAINIKNIAGTVRNENNLWSLEDMSYNVENPATCYGYLAAANNDSYGIQVGSSNTAESFEDFKLNTKILSGSTAGKLAYSASEIPAESYVAGTKTYSVAHIRYFNNNSGGDVTVNEVALSARGNGTSNTTVARDVLGAPVVIPNTGQLKVTYTISLVYPA